MGTGWKDLPLLAVISGNRATFPRLVLRLGQLIMVQLPANRLSLRNLQFTTA